MQTAEMRMQTVQPKTQFHAASILVPRCTCFSVVVLVVAFNVMASTSCFLFFFANCFTFFFIIVFVLTFLIVSSTGRNQSQISDREENNTISIHNLPGCPVFSGQ